MSEKHWIETLKPSAPVWLHAMVAGFMWSAIGIFLTLKGVRLLMFDDTHIIALVISLAIGCAKAFFVLDKAASRTKSRMLTKGDGACLGGFFSLKTWLVLAAMMFIGRLVRQSGLPTVLKGGILVTVGSALFISSRIFWLAFYRLRYKRD